MSGAAWFFLGCLTGVGGVVVWAFLTVEMAIHDE